MTDKWVLYCPKRVQDSIQVSSSPISCSDISESSSSPLLRDRTTSQEMGSEKCRESGNSWFLFPTIPSAEKDRKVMPSSRSFFTKLVYKYKQTHFKLETVKFVRQSLMANDWAVSIDLTDAYLHVPIHPRSRKYLHFVYKHQVFQFTARMSLCPWIFVKLMNVIAAHLRLHAVSLSTHT